MTPSKTTLKRLLWLVILLSLIPASILAARRIGAEGTSVTATLLIDEAALREQAEFMGLSALELAERYRAAGLNGVALYEDTFETAADRGRIALLSAREARSVALALGEAPPELPERATLVREIEADALATALVINGPEARTVTLAGQTWYWWPGEGKERPMGADAANVRRWSEAGFDVAFRPKNFANLQAVGIDWPAEANYLIHMGTEVAGNPNALTQTIQASQPFLTGVIEMTNQDGMQHLAGKVPAARVFSLNQDWLNTLPPREAADKYVLAANERGARLLYVRPYTKGTRGDMIENTELLIRSTRGGLERSGFTIAPVTLLEIPYETSDLLRGLSALGVLAGLVLLGLLYPGMWGLAFAGGTLLLCIVAARGLNWDAFALAAALAFPVIGYGHLRERMSSFFLATLISLAGALLLVAVGSDREAMLAMTPFRGVAATLIVPPLLFGIYYMLRFRPPVAWVREFWNYPVQIGHVAIGVLALAALAVVFLRRGNFPIIGVSETEVGIRQMLSELFARPRFKELFGHPLALLALTNSGWSAWIKGGLLTGGVIAQASIINSFSHYHTPLLISLERTLVALALGLVIGLVMLPFARLVTGGVRRWLERGDAPLVDRPATPAR